jgi:predicted Zn-dependent peptidase
VDELLSNDIICFAQLLQQLHSENKLGRRFPIGLEEQIKKWDVEAIKNFHERWYFPANATLYIVGDIDSVPKTVYHIDVCCISRIYCWFV